MLNKLLENINKYCFGKYISSGLFVNYENDLLFDYKLCIWFFGDHFNVKYSEYKITDYFKHEDY